MGSYVFVCQWYPPEPAAIPRSIALSLSSAEDYVRVLTGIPNYPTGTVPNGYRATRPTNEVIDGLDIRRAPLYPSHDSSTLRRIANYVSWAVAASVFGQQVLRQSDAVLVYSSPATAALPAMVARRLWGIPYVLLVQDVWPDSVFASGFLGGARTRLAHGVMDFFVRRAYAAADHIAVTSPGMIDLLAGRKVPREKLSLVYNWVPEEDEQPRKPRPASSVGSLRYRAGVPDDVCLFLYAGNHGYAQALESLIEAFADERTADAHLVLLGSGVMKPDLMDRAADNPRVHFLDPVPRAEAAELVGDADVSVISLADEPLFAVTLPSKLQSGLVSAKPLLVVARGDAAAVVASANAGAVAMPANIPDIVRAIHELASLDRDQLTAMGQRGRKLYRSTMARSVGSKNLSETLRSVASERRTRRSERAVPTRAKGSVSD